MSMLQELRNKIHEKLLLLRSVERHINTFEFETSFNNLNLEQQEKVASCIYEMDLDKAREIMTPNRHIYEMSIRELREAAKKICVPYYAKLPKSTLLSELISYEKAKSSRKIIARDQNTA